MPGRPHHSEKMKSCVDKVMGQGKDESSAHAICTVSMKKAGHPVFEAAESGSQEEETLIQADRFERAVEQIRAAGGPGSGNFGHSGRPGEQGGSGGGGGTAKQNHEGAATAHTAAAAAHAQAAMDARTWDKLRADQSSVGLVRGGHAMNAFDKSSKEAFSSTKVATSASKATGATKAFAHQAANTYSNMAAKATHVANAALYHEMAATYHRGAAFGHTTYVKTGRSPHVLEEHEELRSFHFRASAEDAHVEQKDGKEYLVVPVVALKEGVIHAVNSASPEFVPASCLSLAPQSWNGRPTVLGHPAKNGVQISANSPKVLEAQGFGQLFDTYCDGERLRTDAWVDVEKLTSLDAKLLKRLQEKETVEVSVGAFVRTLKESGTHNGKEYKAIWKDVIPDHLAFLPNARGACSVAMGCGTNRTLEENELRTAGGSGSGNFGHSGRPGARGGSGGDGGDSKSFKTKEAANSYYDKTIKELKTEGFKTVDRSNNKDETGQIKTHDLEHQDGRQASVTAFHGTTGGSIRNPGASHHTVDVQKTEAPKGKDKAARDIAKQYHDKVLTPVERKQAIKELQNSGFRRSSSGGYTGSWTNLDHPSGHRVQIEQNKTGWANGAKTVENYKASYIFRGAEEKTMNLLDRMKALLARVREEPEEEVDEDEIRTAISSTESDADQRREVLEALKSQEPSVYDITAMYSDRIIYPVYEGGRYCYYQRSYSGNATDGYVVDGNRTKVELVSEWKPSDEPSSYEENEELRTAAPLADKSGVDTGKKGKTMDCPTCDGTGMVNGKDCKNCDGEGWVKRTAEEPTPGKQPTDLDAEAAAATVTIESDGTVKPPKALETSCGCKQGEKMTKEQKTEVIKGLVENKHSGFTTGDEAMLAAASDERLEGFRVAAEARKTEADQLRAATAKTMTSEEFMAAAPPELKALITKTMNADTQRKADIVSVLKTCQTEYNETELSNMKLEELERLVRVAKADVPDADYSARGLSRFGAKDGKDVFANPPDPYKIAIARAKGEKEEKKETVQ